MKRISLIAVSLILFASFSDAADKTKALIALENARTAVTKLEQKGAANKLVIDEISTAKAYLKRAETLYKENISWLLLGGISDAAEPQVRNLAEMSEISASIGLSKLEKLAQEAERKLLDKEIIDAKAKTKVFEDQSKEVAKLKNVAGKYDAAAQDIATLKAQVELYKSDKIAADKLRQDKADLLKQLSDAKAEIAGLTGKVETLKMEKASAEGQIAAMNSEKTILELQTKTLNERVVALEKEQVSLRQKKDEGIQSEKQLSMVNRGVSFRTELSKLGAITDISNHSVTLVLPRAEVIKTTSREHQISRDADKNLKELLSLISKYPDCRISLKAFGFGKPSRLEGKDAADTMAGMVRNYLVLKLGLRADSIPATGDTATSSLFSSKDRESNKRIEITFTLPDSK